jgi:hypothetical protein
VRDVSRPVCAPGITSGNSAGAGPQIHSSVYLNYAGMTLAEVFQGVAGLACAFEMIGALPERSPGATGSSLDGAEGSGFRAKRRLKTRFPDKSVRVHQVCGTFPRPAGNY